MFKQLPIRTISVLFLILFALTNNSAFGFSVPDHKLISEIAFENLKRCQAINLEFYNSVKNEVIEGNLEQDSLVFLPSKWFRYSHFYNPIMPIDSVGPLIFRSHSDQAVAHYTKMILESIQEKKTSTDSARPLGAIMHHLQDASSPLHILAINHGSSDHFEAKFDVQKQVIDQKIDCHDIQNLSALKPDELQKLTGLNTLTKTNQEFSYMENGNKKTGKWNETFFVNKELLDPKIHELIKKHREDKAHQNFFTLGIPEFVGKKLRSGDYGAFLNEALSSSGPDYFGLDSFKIEKNKNGEVVTISVDQSEYINFKKDLMLQSIETSERLILWLYSLK